MQEMQNVQKTTKNAQKNVSKCKIKSQKWLKNPQKSLKSLKESKKINQKWLECPNITKNLKKCLKI